MKILFVLAITSAGFASNALFQSEPGGFAELAPKDRAGYQREQANEKTRRIHLVRVNSEALSSDRINIELFDGQKEDFSIAKRATWRGDSLWVGALGRRGDFRLIRNGDKLSGFILVDARYYSVVPVSGGKAMLLERDLSFQCGTENNDESRPGGGP